MLAAQNYHDVNDSFQPARGGAGGSYGWVGHHVWILPYCEQSALYDELKTAGFPDAEGNGSGRYTRGPSYLLCPSDGGSKRESTWVNNAHKTNYAGSWGDSICQTDESAATSRGFFPGGLYVPNNNADKRNIKTRPMSEITDGTSNTIAYSELVTGDTQGTKKIKGGIGYIPSGADVAIPRNVLNLVSTVDPTMYNGNVCTFERGECYANGNVSITGFQTVLPPNSPSARNYSSGAGQSGWGYGICSASSNHSGGVNCAMVDGSVRFVSDTIDCGDMDANVNGSTYITQSASHGKEFAGKSPFSVWGALGSIAGGESKSI